MAIARPWCCPEPRCSPLLIHGLYTPPKPGASFTCLGRLERPIEFVYDGEQHINDLSHCDYTPLKGVIRWQECEGDWKAMERMYRRAVEKLKEVRNA